MKMKICVVWAATLLFATGCGEGSDDGGTPTCEAMSAEQFCALMTTEQQRICGTVTGPDGCGKQMTADCGTTACRANETCDTATNRCGPCAGEEKAAFCARMASEQGKVCGSITAPDKCGATVTVDCGTTACETGGSCDAVTNQCACAQEEPAAFCARMAEEHGKTCGSITAPDNCGATITVDCGDTACQATEACDESANTCSCAPESKAEFCSSEFTRQSLHCGRLSGTDRCGKPREEECGDAACGEGKSCTALGFCRQCFYTENRLGESKAVLIPMTSMSPDHSAYALAPLGGGTSYAQLLLVNGIARGTYDFATTAPFPNGQILLALLSDYDVDKLYFAIEGTVELTALEPIAATLRDLVFVEAGGLDETGFIPTQEQCQVTIEKLEASLAQSCDPTSPECAQGEGCYLFSAGATPVNVCIEAGTKALGGTCRNSIECAADLVCTNRACAQQCHADTAAPCSDPSLFCAEVNPDTKIGACIECAESARCGHTCCPFEAFCNSNMECEFGSGDTSCDLMAHDCPEGEACYDVPSGDGTACEAVGSAAPGETCNASPDCVEGSVCAADGVCRQLCVDAEACAGSPCLDAAPTLASAGGLRFCAIEPCSVAGAACALGSAMGTCRKDSALAVAGDPGDRSDFTCAPDGVGALDSSCTTSLDCGAGLGCIELVCRPHVESDGTCADGADIDQVTLLCVPLPPPPPTRCDPLMSTSCEEGTVCQATGTQGPFFTTCIDSSKAGLSAEGTACEGDAECAPGLACHEKKFTCTPYCSLDAPSCPETMQCRDIDTALTFGVCL